MGRKFLFTVVAFLTCATIYAQKERLIVHQFTRSSEVSEGDFITVKNMVISAFNETERFEMLDASQQKMIDKESVSRVSSNAIYDVGSNAGNIKTKANRYALEGAVSVCDVTKQEYEGTVSYACILVYTVSIIDLEENTTVVTETFKHTPPPVGKITEGLGSSTLGLLAGRASGEANTPDKAKQKVFKHINNDIKKLVNDEFPLKGNVFAEDYTVNKDKMTACFINIGEAHGVGDGDKFTIFETIIRVGTEIVQEIGELTVVTVHKDVAECKINKGGKEVMKAMERYIENVDAGDANARPLKVIIKK
ncbi:MAG: hypothetical protein J6Q48_06840 [Bacteroidaceae bacterium]|nr:hypothetical protein [Bacteroidaceae bacterium]